jgi:hypothetical protein
MLVEECLQLQHVLATHVHEELGIHIPAHAKGFVPMILDRHVILEFTFLQ